MNNQNKRPNFKKFYNWLIEKEPRLSQFLTSTLVFIYTYIFCSVVLYTNPPLLVILKYLSPILIFALAFLLYKIFTTLLRVHNSKKRVSSILSSNESPRDQAYKLLHELDRVALYEFEFISFIFCRKWPATLHAIIDEHIIANQIQLSYKDFINFDKR